MNQKLNEYLTKIFSEAKAMELNCDCEDHKKSRLTIDELEILEKIFISSNGYPFFMGLVAKTVAGNKIIASNFHENLVSEEEYNKIKQ